tara:strand:- start:114 stop:452 length:339 start_codon:yes stop_codon:yes gene_type:complete
VYIISLEKSIPVFISLLSLLSISESKEVKFIFDSIDSSTLVKFKSPIDKGRSVDGQLPAISTQLIWIILSVSSSLSKLFESSIIDGVPKIFVENKPVRPEVISPVGFTALEL